MSFALVLALVGAIISAIAGFWKDGVSWKSAVMLVGALVTTVGVMLSSIDQDRLNKEYQTSLKKIADLGSFTIASVTGGASFCYLQIHQMAEGWISPTLIHRGQHPVYDLQIYMIDLDLMDEGHKQRDPKKVAAASWEYNVGTVGPSLSRGLVPVIPFPPQDRSVYRLRADITARNGQYIEMIHGRKIDGRWKFAVRLIPFKGGPEFEEIPPEFPLDAEGKYNWNGPFS